jgi:RNA polymerase sigma factor (TIGR02999 family)
MTEVTRILESIEQGDTRASEQLLPLVYDELRKLAGALMARESPGQTLQATALVHEAYLRLVGGDSKKPWDGRGHFFGAAAEAMRRILVENARRKQGPKRGGGRLRLDLPDVGESTQISPDDLLEVDEALTRFAEVAPQKAELVKLRFFAGMTIPEAAAALGISHATAERHWTYARAWLYSELHGEGDPQ